MVRSGLGTGLNLNFGIEWSGAGLKLLAGQGPFPRVRRRSLVRSKIHAKNLILIV